MSGGLTRACATASALFALLFLFAIAFGAFSPPAHSPPERPHIAQGH